MPEGSGEKTEQRHRGSQVLHALDRWAANPTLAGGLGPVSELLDVVTVSPKLANSGMLAPRRLRPAVLAELAANPCVVWKFVVDDVSDLDEVDELVARYSMRNVFVMPQATTRDQVLARTVSLVAPAVARGYRVSTRLHILLWDNQRGR